MKWNEMALMEWILRICAQAKLDDSEFIKQTDNPGIDDAIYDISLYVYWILHIQPLELQSNRSVCVSNHLCIYYFRMRFQCALKIGYFIFKQMME